MLGQLKKNKPLISIISSLFLLESQINVPWWAKSVIKIGLLLKKKQLIIKQKEKMINFKEA
jgi:hypothetical protein